MDTIIFRGMKKIVLLSLLLLGAFYVEAQVLISKKEKLDYGSIRNEMHDTIMKPFRERGKATNWLPKDRKRLSEHGHSVQKSVVNQEIEDKLKEIDGHILIECYFDSGGKIIDVVFFVKEVWAKKFTMEDWQYIYNRLRSIILPSGFIEWEGEPNYGCASFILGYNDKL